MLFLNNLYVLNLFPESLLILSSCKERNHSLYITSYFPYNGQIGARSSKNNGKNIFEYIFS